MEDGFPPLRAKLLNERFIGWEKHTDFLLPYMQMIRARSPQYFEEQKRALDAWKVAKITSIAEDRKSLTVDDIAGYSLSDAEIQNWSLGFMRNEIKNGATWMADFHWQLRTTFDPYNPVITSESPLTVAGDIGKGDGPMTMEILKQSAVYFPLCWQACLVGRAQPFDRDLVTFEQSDLGSVNTT